MIIKRICTTGDEVMAFSNEKKYMNWSAGQRKAIKVRTNRRERREGKVDLRQYW